MKLPLQKPLTILVDRGIWESVTHLLTNLTKNPNGESLYHFQGYAETILEDLAEKQPPASQTLLRSSAAGDRNDHPTGPDKGQQLSRS